VVEDFLDCMCAGWVGGWAYIYLPLSCILDPCKSVQVNLVIGLVEVSHQDPRLMGVCYCGLI